MRHFKEMPLAAWLIMAAAILMICFSGCKKEEPVVPPTNPPLNNQPTEATYSNYKVILQYTKINQSITNIGLDCYRYDYDTIGMGYNNELLYAMNWQNTALSGYYKEVEFTICDTTTSASIMADVSSSAGQDNCQISVYKEGILIAGHSSSNHAYIFIYPNQ